MDERATSLEDGGEQKDDFVPIPICKYAADGRYSEFLDGNEKQLVDRLGRA